LQDHIKSILTRIDLLENEGSIEAGMELGKLYGRLKNAGFKWSTRDKRWVLNDDSVTSKKENTFQVPPGIQNKGNK